VLQVPQAGAPITVWVKRMDVADAQYVAVKGVDLQLTVDDFKARWIAQARLDVDPSLVTLWLVKCGTGKPTPNEETKSTELDDFKASWVDEEKLDVRPSLVTLRLVKRGAGKPTAKQEAKAKMLDDPSLSLTQAKVTGTSWVLAFVLETKANAELVARSASLPGACIACMQLHPRFTRVRCRCSFTSGKLCSARRKLRAQGCILPWSTRLRAARLLRGCRSYGHVAGVALAQNGSQQVGWRDDCKRRHCSFDDHHRHSQGVFGGLTCQQPVLS